MTFYGQDIHRFSRLLTTRRACASSETAAATIHTGIGLCESMQRGSMEGTAMPIMATHAQNDVRGSARILADTAIACIDNEAFATSNRVSLNNVYRLLQAYRSNVFFGVQSPARDCSLTQTDYSLAPLAESYVMDVKEAIDEAFSEVFVNKDRDQAISTVEMVLKAVAYPAEHGPAESESRSAARDFFSRIVERLTLN